MSVESNNSEPGHLLLSGAHKVLAIIVYSSMSITAISGNSLIALVYAHFPRLRTATNILILNLAIADLMISILCMPFSYWHVIIFSNQRWIFGSTFCKLLSFLQATAVFLSSWTLVAISFDRFTAIVFVLNLRWRVTKRRAFMLVAITWTFSIIMAAPLFYVNQIVEHDGFETCEEYGWTYIEEIIGDKLMHLYGPLVFALQYCLPLLVVVVTYAAIGVKMWKSGVPSDQNSRRYATTDRHECVRKMIRMVLLVSALYAGCWLPQNLLMNIVLPYNPDIGSDPRILYYWWIANTIAMLHSVVNPFVYYHRNARFREGFGHFLKFIPWMRFNDQILLGDKKLMKPTAESSDLLNSRKRVELIKKVSTPSNIMIP